jgi:FtsP/CotA-like multicopper oxidase with cupredoxin domain
MSTSRREFLKLSAAVGAATLVPWRRVYAYGRSPLLRKFIQPLPALGPGGIPIAQARPFMHGVDWYQIVAGEYTQQLHPELPPTKLWGYADATTGVHRHLGPVIVANRGTPIRLSVTNALPNVHPLPVDVSLPGADLAPNRMSLHLHGGFVPWVSDGGPFAWFDPSGAYGPSAVDVPGLGPRVPGTFNYYYPNDQSARLLWYHDHAIGITRLNAYAGLASAYVLRDLTEAALIASGAIPSREIPLVIQDKIFKTEADTWGLPGDLWYPSVYEPERWEIAPPELIPPEPSCVPEFFGDTMLVNGVVYPSARVEPRRYRLRVLNACNARFCSLRLLYAKGQGFPDSTEADLRRAGPPFVQIGTEGGFLPAPVVLDGARPSRTLLLAPAERADLIVDFSNVAPGSILLLYNDAPAPFPMGDRSVDFDADDRGHQSSTQPGFGPNTRTLLQIVVGPRVGAVDDSAALTLPPLDPPPIVPSGVTALPPGIPIRELTLNEDFDAFGRLLQRLGTTEPLYAGTLARNYEDPPTETPQPDAIEAWRIFNLSADTHPIHFHLVNVQIVSRQSFDARHMRLQGTPRPADANERGWKETVRMNPGECTTVIMKFALPSAPFIVPASPRTGGHEYVWHCHILEHEEHDMMRPLVVG